MDAPHILIFSPYAERPHLTMYEGTIARACQLRGAAIEYLLCDGLLPECDQHWDSFGSRNDTRPADLCERCQAGAKAQLAQMALPYRWLGGFVSPIERAEAQAWAQSVPVGGLSEARYQGRPLGDWVQSSVISYFRQFPPDFTKPRVILVYRGFLYSAAVVATGLLNYLAKHPIDSALLYNARQSITRVAFEVFRERGIRVLTHELPFYLRGHLNLKPNARCWSLWPFIEFWREWRNVPLNQAALAQTLDWIRNRRYAKGLPWYAFNKANVRTAPVREALHLDPHKRLFALFTSSTDEFAADPELQGLYELQSDWVKAVVEWVKGRNDVELVIRVHPNLAGNSGLTRATDEFNYYRDMAAALPANIRVVMPDDPLNSYALTDEADVGLTFGSTIGLEMAMLGKPVVLASRAIYEDGAQFLTIRSKESLPEILEKCLGPFSPREIRREAFRLAYYYVFAFEAPFPLVAMEGILETRLTYTDLAALAPGKDWLLDRASDYLAKGTPFYASPSAAELARPVADEDGFFAELEKSPDYLRNPHDERWLPRLAKIRSYTQPFEQMQKRLPLGMGRVPFTISKGIWRSFVKWLDKKA